MVASLCWKPSRSICVCQVYNRQVLSRIEGPAERAALAPCSGLAGNHAIGARARDWHGERRYAVEATTQILVARNPHHTDIAGR